MLASSKFSKSYSAGFLSKGYHWMVNHSILDLGYTKTERRKYRYFNFGVLFSIGFALINAIFYFNEDRTTTSFICFLFAAFYAFIFFTYTLPIHKKPLPFFCLMLLHISMLAAILARDSKVSELFGIMVIVSSLYLKRRHFYPYLLASTLLYHIHFFYFEYGSHSNTLSFIPYVVLALILRGLFQDAEKNEQIIETSLLRLSELDRLKDRLYSNISHEFRTPLSIIIGVNDLPEADRNKEIIRSQSLRLLELVNQILDLAEVQSKHRKIRLSAPGFSAYLEGVLLGFKDLCESKGLSFNHHIHLHAEAILIDKDALSKIVLNLLSNAVKFSFSTGQITLKIEQSQDDTYKIIVSDTGRGIDEKRMEEIFNQFYHTNSAVAPSSGIGLSLVKELVESLGGTIDVTSQVNQGTTFTVELPATLEKFEAKGVTYELDSEEELT